MIRGSSKGSRLGKGKQDRHLQLIQRQAFDLNLGEHGVKQLNIKQAEIAKQDMKSY